MRKFLYSISFLFLVFQIYAQTPSTGAISVSGGTGTAGAFIVGSSVVAQWDNSVDAGISGVSAVEFNFTEFGGPVSVSASDIGGGIWEATYPISGAGTTESTTADVTVTVTATTGGGTTQDDENNTVDDLRPTVSSIVLADADPTNAGSVDFTVTFSESVAGVDIGDFIVDQSGLSGVSITGVSGTGDTYTVSVSTGTGEGSLSIDFDFDASGGADDVAGNTTAADFAGGAAYTVDLVVPSVSSIILADADPTNAASVDFTVTFSESVTGVDIGDFVIDQSGLTGPSITGVSGTGDTYTVSVSTGTGSGSLSIDFDFDASGGVTDGVNTSDSDFTGGAAYTIDNTPPTVNSIVLADADPTNAGSVDFTVTFSESVTGVDIGDFVIDQSGLTGPSVTGVSGTGDTYTVSVSTGTGNGSLSIDFDFDASGGVTDGVGNVSNADFTGGAAYTIDKTAPTFIDATFYDFDNDGSIDEVLVEMSEPIDESTIEAADFILDGSAASFSVVPGGTTNNSSDVSTVDNFFTINVSGINTTDDVSFEYQQNNAGLELSDFAGNEAADDNTVTRIDMAAPVLTDVQIEDANNDGIIDLVTYIFSEIVVDAVGDGDGNDDSDIGTITMPDGTTTFDGGGGNALGSSNLTLTNDGTYGLLVLDVETAGYSVVGTGAGATDVTGSATQFQDDQGLTGVEIAENIIDLAKPRIMNATISGNSLIDITFSEGVYGNMAASTEVIATNFVLSVSAGGLAPITIDGINATSAETSADANVLAGGETEIRIFFSLSGSPAGGETITVDTDGGIYDDATIAADVTQYNTDNQADLSAPVIPRITIARWLDQNGDGTIDGVEMTFDINYDIDEDGSPDNTDGLSCFEIRNGGVLVTQDGVDYDNTNNGFLDAGDFFTLQFTSDPQPGTSIADLTLEYIFDSNDRIESRATNDDSPVGEVTFNGGRYEDGAAPRFVNFTATVLDTDIDGNVDQVRVDALDHIDDSAINPAEFTYNGVVATGVANVDNTDESFYLTVNGNGTGVEGDFVYTPGTSLLDTAGLASDGGTILSTSVIDGAGPIILNAITYDTDATPNGQIDEIVVTFSETLATVYGDDTYFSVDEGGDSYTVTNASATASDEITLTITEGAYTGGPSGPLDTHITPDITITAGFGDDAAGALTPGQTFTNTSDGAAPLATVNTLTTDDASPDLDGDLDDPNATILVNVSGNGNVFTRSATNDGDGTWSFTNTGSAPNGFTLSQLGTYEVTTISVDPSGNTGTDGTNNELVINGGANITPATPGAFCPSDGFVSLGQIEIDESADGDFASSGTILLTLPEGFEFDTSIPANFSNSSLNDISAITGTYIGTASLRLNITVGGTSGDDIVRIDDLEVQATLGGQAAVVLERTGGTASLLTTDTDYAVLTSNEEISDITSLDETFYGSANILSFDIRTGLSFTLDADDQSPDDMQAPVDTVVNWYENIFDGSPEFTGLAATESDLNSAEGLYTYYVANDNGACDSQPLEFQLFIFSDDDPSTGAVDSTFVDRTYIVSDDTDTIYMSNPTGHTVSMSGAGITVTNPGASPAPLLVIFDPGIAGDDGVGGSQDHIITYNITNNTTGESISRTITLTVDPETEIFAGSSPPYCSTDGVVTLHADNTGFNSPNDAIDPYIQYIGVNSLRHGAINFDLDGPALEDGIYGSGAFEYELDMSGLGIVPGDFENIQFARVIRDAGGTKRTDAVNYYLVFAAPYTSLTNISSAYCEDDAVVNIRREIKYVASVNDNNPADPVPTYGGTVDGDGNIISDELITNGYFLYRSSDGGATYPTLYADFTASGTLTNTFDPSNPDQDGDLLEATDVGFFRIIYETEAFTPNSCSGTHTVDVVINSDTPTPLMNDASLAGGGASLSTLFYSAGPSFSIGEIVIGESSGARGVIQSDDGSTMILTQLDGTFSAGENIYGFTSGSSSAIVTLGTQPILINNASPDSGVDGDEYVLEFCVGDVSPTFSTDNTDFIRWYNSGFGEIGNHLVNTPSITASAAGLPVASGRLSGEASVDFYFTAEDVTGCESDFRKITVNVYPIPDAPIFDFSAWPSEVESGSNYFLDYCVPRGSEVTPFDITLDEITGAGDTLYNVNTYYNGLFSSQLAFVSLSGVSGGPYVLGETVTGSTSLSTAIVHYHSGSNLVLRDVSGTFVRESIIGSVSSASATITGFTFERELNNETFSTLPIQHIGYIYSSTTIATPFTIGETITAPSGATGEVYRNYASNYIFVKFTSETRFEAGELITGSSSGSTLTATQVIDDYISSYYYIISMISNQNESSNFAGCEGSAITVYTYGRPAPTDPTISDLSAMTTEFHVREGGTLSDITHTAVGMDGYVWYENSNMTGNIGDTLTSGESMTEAILSSVGFDPSSVAVPTVNDLYTYYFSRIDNAFQSRGFDGCESSGTLPVNITVHAIQPAPDITSDNSASSVNTTPFTDLNEGGVVDPDVDYYFSICTDRLEADNLFVASEATFVGNRTFRWYAYNNGTMTRGSEYTTDGSGTASLAELQLTSLSGLTSPTNRYFEVVQVTDDVVFDGVESQSTLVRVQISPQDGLVVVDDLDAEISSSYCRDDDPIGDMSGDLNIALRVQASGGDVLTDTSNVDFEIDSYLESTYLAAGLPEVDRSLVLDSLPTVNLVALHDAVPGSAAIGGEATVHVVNMIFTDPITLCEGSVTKVFKIYPDPNVSFTLSDVNLDGLQFCYDDPTIVIKGFNVSLGTDISFAEGTGSFSINTGGLQNTGNNRAEFTPKTAHDFVNGGSESPYASQSQHRIFYNYEDEFGCVRDTSLLVYVNPRPEILTGVIQAASSCATENIELFVDLSDDESNYTFSWRVGGATIDNSEASLTDEDGNVSDEFLTYNLQSSSANFGVTVTHNVTGCQTSINLQQITVGEAPEPTLTWAGITEGRPTSFRIEEDNGGLADANVDSIGFNIDGLQIFSDESNPFTFPYDFDYTFTNSGTFELITGMRTTAGCRISDTTEITIIDHFSGLTSYTEDFESGAGSWTIETLSLDGKDNTLVTSWEIGTNVPDSTAGTTYDGTTAVYTNGYQASEQSFVYSPSFDLSAFTAPTISFLRYEEFETFRDGVVLQMSTDDGRTWVNVGSFDDFQPKGLKSTPNWYNREAITSAPGTVSPGPQSVANNAQGIGWAEDSDWKEAKSPLSIPEGEEEYVRFRFALAAQNTPKTTNGFGFDLFQIYEREGIVLVEQFSSTLSQPSYSINKSIDNLPIFQGNDIVRINYFTDFANNGSTQDQLNQRNTSGPGARSSYYGISDVPSMSISGNSQLITGASQLTGSIEAQLTNAKLVNPAFEIAINASIDSDNILTVGADFTAVSDLTSNDTKLGLFLAILEPQIIVDNTMDLGLYQVDDTITNVMRKMLPSAAGQFEEGAVAISDVLSIEDMTWSISKMYVMDTLTVVAFVQNLNNKQILQSSVLGLSNPNTELALGLDDISDISLYPNPADKQVTVEFGEELREKTEWVIFDQLGREIMKGELSKGTRTMTVQTEEMPSGLYFLHLYAEDRKRQAKRIMVVH